VNTAPVAFTTAAASFIVQASASMKIEITSIFVSTKKKKIRPKKLDIFRLFFDGSFDRIVFAFLNV
jgi:hypothetical protein